MAHLFICIQLNYYSRTIQFWYFIANRHKFLDNGEMEIQHETWWCHNFKLNCFRATKQLVDMRCIYTIQSDYNSPRQWALSSEHSAMWKMMIQSNKMNRNKKKKPKFFLSQCGAKTKEEKNKYSHWLNWLQNRRPIHSHHRVQLFERSVSPLCLKLNLFVGANDLSFDWMLIFLLYHSKMQSIYVKLFNWNFCVCLFVCARNKVFWMLKVALAFGAFID